MYTLTLTKDERKAIDWIGDRYPIGHDFYKLLIQAIPEDMEWGCDDDITFQIPENLAWLMAEIIECEDSIACLSGSLVSKLWEFSSKIV